ncbi:MAG: ankyrin repeat domain-containing protein [Wolbachia endosymbiont of Halictus tumulorum]|nr:ankyrin repeat domain-containing protein [Wolbachia endosymbiont of Halictus tumulorum]
MNSEELQKILAENEKKGSLLKELSSAVTKNDLEKVKSIFERNSPIIKDVVAEVNSANSTNLLGYAVDSEMAKYLREQGVSFTAAIKNAIPDLEVIKSICEVNKSIVKHELQKDTSILYAIISREFNNDINDIIKYLIEQGANPDAQDHNRYLLHLCIAQGNLKGAKAFIENGADVNIVNQEENGYWMSGIDGNAQKGQTALFFAIRAYTNNIDLNPEKANEALEFINFLIERKANLNVQDCNGKTPLVAAMFFDAPEVVRLLIKAGADLNIGKEKAKDILNYAVTKGHTDIGKAAIRYILEHNSRSNKLDLLNNQEELSVYWDEYKAQVNASEDFCPRKLAVISVAAISCALALYFLAPLIIGSAAGVGTQLALGAVGAVVGSGIGHLTNVAIDQCYVNSATQKAD